MVLLVVLDVSEISVTPTDVRTAAVRAPCRGTFSLADSQPVSAKVEGFISHLKEKGKQEANVRLRCPERIVAFVERVAGIFSSFECQHVPSR